MSTNTLTSLAILKVNMDHKGDYLDQLKPFIIQILLDEEPNPVTVEDVSKHIDIKFGLIIPARTIKLVLKRITKQHPVKRSHGSYRIIGKLPNSPQIEIKKKEAKKHFDFAVEGLQNFSQNTVKPISDPDEAVISISSFLAKFDITCLSAYVRGTAIPRLNEDHPVDFILISNYVKHIQQHDPERFNSFIVIVQGHMLANALLCPDLHKAPKTYKNTIFYLDTPLIIKLLGLEGKPGKYAADELVDLIRNLGGKIAAFSHTFIEVKNAVIRAADNIDCLEYRASIAREARRIGTSRSDLIIEAGSMEQKFYEASIEIMNSPNRINKFQIDELKLESELKSRKSFWRHNPRATQCDIESVQSIYTIRANKSIVSLEKSQAILVTSNDELARAAWDFGQSYPSSRYVSSVITDFALANVSWLKSPMGAPSLPRAQVLAICYAALTPSEGFLEKFLKEVDKLQDEGKISEHKHQLARITPEIEEELMQFTLGQDSALTEETILHKIDRVHKDIKKEEIEKLTQEQEAHRKTRRELHSKLMKESEKFSKEQEAHKETKQEIAKKLYWECNSKAKTFSNIWSYGPLTIIITITIIGILVESGFRLPDSLSWTIIYKNIVLTSLAIASSAYGITINKVKAWIKKRRLNHLLDRQSKITDLDFEGVSS